MLLPILDTPKTAKGSWSLLIRFPDVSTLYTKPTWHALGTMLIRHPGLGATQRVPVDVSKSRPLMKLHSWSAAKMLETSTTLIGLPVVTSSSVTKAHPVLPDMHVFAFRGKLPTQRWLPSQARAPASLNSVRVLRRTPLVVVRKMSLVQSHGCEYQRFFPSKAKPTGQ